MGSLKRGDVVLMQRQQGVWLQLLPVEATGGQAARHGWMLRDGSSLGLKQLLKLHVSLVLTA